VFYGLISTRVALKGLNSKLSKLPGLGIKQRKRKINGILTILCTYSQTATPKHTQAS